MHRIFLALLRRRVIIATCVPLLILTFSTVYPQPGRSQEDAKIEDWVLVTEDRAMDDAGCDAISGFNVTDGSDMIHSDTYISPGRLTANDDASLSVSTLSNSCAFGYDDPPLLECTPALIGLGSGKAGAGVRSSGRIRGRKFATMGGVAFLQNRSVLVAESGYAKNDLSTILVPRSPYFVAHIRIPTAIGNRDALAESLGRVSSPSLPVEIVRTHVPNRAAVVLADGTVGILDADAMQWIGSPIPYPTPISGYNRWYEGKPSIVALHATLTFDGIGVLVNGMKSPSVSLIDLSTRSSRSIALSPDLTFVGGISVNSGWENSGLLAVHAVDKVVVFRIQQDMTAVELGRVAIDPPSGAAIDGLDVVETADGGPLFSVAWSGSGSRLIAATDHEAAEFVVIGVGDAGQSLSIERYVTVCSEPINRPNDIWTANGLLTPPPSPTPTPSTSPTPTLTAPPTPSPLATSTPSPLPTATPSPTATPTPLPAPIYLPLALTESCTPSQRHVDIALAIDASSSMTEPTAAGRTKLAAAVDAARTFLGTLRLAEGDQAAIVTFNSDAWLHQPLTDDRAALDAALSSITTASLTRLDRAVAVAAEALADPARRRAENAAAMIVLTDGRANPVPADVAVAEAARAKAAGVTVFTVGVGYDLDVDALRAIASRPADAFLAPDAEALAGIYSSIAVRLPCPVGVFWGRR